MGRYNDLIDRLDRYTVGTLVIDDGLVLLRTGERYLTLTNAKSIEVLHVGESEVYHAFTCDECLALVDAAGWSLLAGLYARVLF